MKWVLLLAILAAPAQAQHFTMQAEVHPILEVTRANWVELETDTGRDLLYFTHLQRTGVDASQRAYRKPAEDRRCGL